MVSAEELRGRVSFRLRMKLRKIVNYDLETKILDDIRCGAGHTCYVGTVRFGLLEI